MRRRNGRYLTPAKSFGIGRKNFFQDSNEIIKDIHEIEDWLDHVLEYYAQSGSSQARKADYFVEDIRQKLQDFKYEFLFLNKR